jgi:hypothetical protein
MGLFSRNNKKKSIFDLELILKMDNYTHIEMAITEYLQEKSSHGDSMDMLTEPQRNFLLVEYLIQEVNHGGLFHYFYFWNGGYALETVQALGAVKAFKIKSILEEAISLLPNGSIPKDRIEQQDILEKLEAELETKFEHLDRKFYYEPNSIDNYGLLLLDYVKENKEHFKQ